MGGWGCFHPASPTAPGRCSLAMQVLGKLRLVPSLCWEVPPRAYGARLHLPSIMGNIRWKQPCLPGRPWASCAWALAPLVLAATQCQVGKWGHFCPAATEAHSWLVQSLPTRDRAWLWVSVQSHPTLPSGLQGTVGWGHAHQEPLWQGGTAWRPAARFHPPSFSCRHGQ